MWAAQIQVTGLSPGFRFAAANLPNIVILTPRTNCARWMSSVTQPHCRSWLAKCYLQVDNLQTTDVYREICTWDPVSRGTAVTMPNKDVVSDYA